MRKTNPKVQSKSSKKVAVSDWERNPCGFNGDDNELLPAVYNMSPSSSPIPRPRDCPTPSFYNPGAPKNTGAAVFNPQPVYASNIWYSSTPPVKKHGVARKKK